MYKVCNKFKLEECATCTLPTACRDCPHRLDSKFNCLENCPFNRGFTCLKCFNVTRKQWVRDMIMLFNRCKRHRCLPEEGGVLDQDCLIMDCFDIISEEQNKFEEAEREKLSRGINKG